MRKISKPSFSVHPFAVPGLFILFFVLQREVCIAVIISAAAHELSHLSASVITGGSLRKITLSPCGLELSLSPARSYGSEIFIALAGPCMNDLLMLLSPLCAGVRRKMLYTSAVMLIINLLPVPTLDGGRALGALLSLLLGERASSFILTVTGCAALFFLWIISVYIFFYTAENAALLIFCSYLFAFLVLKKGEKRATGGITA